jgi:hypothetical protein
MTDENPLNLSMDILGEVVAYTTQAAEITAVSDSETAERAKVLRAQLKTLESKIEQARVAANVPYLAAQRQINGLANVIFEQIRPQIKRLDDLRLAYSQAFTKPVMPVVPMPGPELGVPNLAAFATGISDSAPEIRTRKTKDIEIMDPSQIPDEFWVIDITALRKAVLTDKRDVPGVRIIEKTSVLE